MDSRTDDYYDDRDRDMAEWNHHQELLQAQEEAEKQERIDKAIRECEKALQAFWQARDELEHGPLWGNQ